MIEPASFLSGMGGSIAGIVSFSNLVLGLKNCPEEAKTCFSFVQLVHADIQFAVSLRTTHRAILEQRPHDAKRIDDILQSASRSLDSVGSLVERLNPDAHSGKIPYRKRLRWFLGDSASFALRTRDLQTQHAAVQGEIAWLRMVELIAPIHAVAETKTSFDNFDLWKRDRRADDRDDDDVDHGRTAPNRHFLSPDPPAANALFHVPSAQTLLGSVSDNSQLGPNEHVNSWVQNSWDSDRDYSEAGTLFELPGSYDSSENAFSRQTTDTAEEADDDVGLFFRAWRESQMEQREEAVELG